MSLFDSIKSGAQKAVQASQAAIEKAKELFPSMDTRGTAHRIFFGSTDSDDVFRFLPFRA